MAQNDTTKTADGEGIHRTFAIATDNQTADAAAGGLAS